MSMSNYWRPLGGHTWLSVYSDRPPILTAFDESGDYLTITGLGHEQVSSEHLAFVRDLADKLAEYVREYERWVESVQVVSSGDLAAVE